MKKTVLVCLAAVMTLLGAAAQGADVENARALAGRVVPSIAGRVEFKKIKAQKGRDCFTLASAGDKIVIEGNNANSMAMGLNHYLKKYCLATVSWYDGVPTTLPAVLPAVAVKERVEAKVPRRFFLNYCTYGYTMPFWQWKDWEHFIDWMALNGINMPLAITGQEGVWYNVWRRLGMSDVAVRSYFTGPAYLPWHRMANIDRWDGPLPKEWLDGQIELQKQILRRERDLNMKPVLPAFAGHVPKELARLYPNANIKQLGSWDDFSDEYRCNFLNPEEPLFAEIQKLFLEEQTRLFGTDHIYGVDPFNEVDPPSWDEEYLGNVSKNMYRTLTAVDPKAEWLQMTWMFYYESKKWTAPRIKALLGGVKKGCMSLLDYHCEKSEMWQKTDKFHGQPYIWCYLGNFGGNTAVMGNVKEAGKRIDNTLVNGGQNLVGLGSTLEGLDVNQFPFEYVFDKAWTFNADDEAWTRNLADRHAGAAIEPVRKAWDILFNDVFNKTSRPTQGILPNYRPELNKKNRHTTIAYDPARLGEAWRLLLESPQVKTDALTLDLIIVGRQALGDVFEAKKNQLDEAYNEGNIDKMRMRATEMCEILRDLDALTACHPYTTLSTWTGKARDLAVAPEVKDYYEKDAKMLITTWGGRLNDYASRTWAGLVGDYYATRWTMYIDALLDSARTGVKFDQKAFNARVAAYEHSWAAQPTPAATVRKYDLLTFSRILYKKWMVTE